MKKYILIASLALPTVSFAYSTVFNPFTGKLDYVGVSTTSALSLSTITAISATFGSVSDTSYGNHPYVVISASGASEGMTVNIYGQPSGGLQNKIGGLTVNALGPAGPAIDMVVIRSSYPSVQEGSAMLWMFVENPLRNDPIGWIRSVANNSSPGWREDMPAPNDEIVATSTDNAHGLGKWEPHSVAFQGVDLQVNDRAYDNSTFENVAFWHPLHLAAPGDTVMPGLYLQTQNSDEDGTVVPSSGTSVIGFFTLNNHTRSLTGPPNTTASWTDALPDTPGSTGQMMYHGANVLDGITTVRQWKWSGNDFLYSATTGVNISTFTANTVTLSTAAFSGSTFSTLGAEPNGSMKYCTDCTVTTAATCTTNVLASCVCAGSGPGAFAKRANGSWYCN
jgi:hypothetical protein